ncbi:hypothetical protein GYN07_11370 [Rhizobium leguminosarum bv. viciae 248]|nr:MULTISPECIES: hypothetical protein [Rhizobium]MBY5839496.1 hypothetical protein [Rhizobium leguminosarum]MCA2408175.1 hypothetical protein [Rhizobium leguminosarum]MDU0360103.1 hypothetical protein [Rhizobium sp. 25PS6]QHW24898.1 hypothetical protein GYN07_11370 [Rhizobium leguminosarum bv. viciae 248]QSZ05980.1 hypothetical protein J3P71_13755 [Rhizobium leguminosarum]
MANTTHELAASFAEEWLILPFDYAEMQDNAELSRVNDFKTSALNH